MTFENNFKNFIYNFLKTAFVLTCVHYFKRKIQNVYAFNFLNIAFFFQENALCTIKATVFEYDERILG